MGLFELAYLIKSQTTPIRVVNGFGRGGEMRRMYSQIKVHVLGDRVFVSANNICQNIIQSV